MYIICIYSIYIYILTVPTVGPFATSAFLGASAPGLPQTEP